MTHAPTALRRELGLGAVAALVIGNMIGSGIFFTPGELAAVAQHPWQVHFIWALSGVITLCGALTLAELCTLFPQAGATFHIMREAYGPVWAFALVWLELWVTGPGAIASSAVALGGFMHRSVTVLPGVSDRAWGAAAILLFGAVNLAGVRWGGRTQVLLTAAKVLGIGALIVGGLILVAPAAAVVTVPAPSGASVLAFLRFTGLGIAVVLFTYDGWIDVTNVAGEVRRPERDFPLGLGAGVALLTVIYVVVNAAYLRAVPLAQMRADPSGVASALATAAFGARGGAWLTLLMTLSILGALGGLVMTQPRLFYTLAVDSTPPSGTTPGLFRLLQVVSPRTAVPSGAIVFTTATSLVALFALGTFTSLVNFFVVPLQVATILMVGALFRLRRRRASGGYRTPGYPVTPIVYMVVMSAFVVSAVVFRPFEPIVGLALAATGVPVYRYLHRAVA